MGAQWIDQRRGQHRDPVLRSLPPPDHDLPPLEIQILDPQCDPLHQPHPTAVQQQAKQTVHAIKPPYHPLDLLPREDHRQPRRRSPARQSAQPLERQVEHMVVEKEERRQGLCLRRLRDAPLIHQPRQECANLRNTELPGMT